MNRLSPSSTLFSMAFTVTLMGTIGLDQRALCSTQLLENFLAIFEVGVVQASDDAEFFIGLLNPSENDFSTIESFSILAWRITFHTANSQN